MVPDSACRLTVMSRKVAGGDSVFNFKGIFFYRFMFMLCDHNSFGVYYM